MKHIYIILLLFISTTSAINAQNFKSGSITNNNNNQVIEGRIAIDNSEKKILLKKDGKIKTYTFNGFANATINGRLYSKINFEDNTYFAHQLESGNASLFDLSNSNYLILKDDGLGKFINLEKDKTQIPGVLAALFNDCNSVRDAINSSDEINEHSLKNIISNYNNCSYSDYAPTETEIDKANTYNTDVYRFYIGVQSGFNNTTVNDFNSNNTAGFGLGLGLSASPSFTGNLQGNLYFDFDFSMMFTGDSDFNNQIDQPLNYKVNSYRLSVGMEYLFNKKGTIQPFLGIGYGYTFDYYKGDIETISFKDEDKNYFFIPKAGLLYKLNNGKHIGLTISYITEYENDLSFLIGDDSYYPLVIENSSFTVGVNYYF